MIKVHVREWYLYKVDCLREIYRCVSIERICIISIPSLMLISL